MRVDKIPVVIVINYELLKLSCLPMVTFSEVNRLVKLRTPSLALHLGRWIIPFGMHQLPGLSQLGGFVKNGR